MYVIIFAHLDAAVARDFIAPAGTIVDLPFDISKQAVDLQVEIEGYKACNPYEVGGPLH